MICELLVTIVLPAALVVAAVWDMASFTIPNQIPLVLLVTFVAFGLIAGFSPAAFGAHALAGFLGLLMGFVLFALGYVGGGDAKLFACIALWFGLMDIATFALAASLFGGALTLGLLFFRQFPVPKFLSKQAWLLRLHDPRGGVPYGVALAAGGFATLPYTDVFRAGVGG